ncbi:MAG TPA: sulfatase-like hydrolase/transferase [Thermoanaerobaculia bacterium]|nr:sulfatase-like hydrolase/transferase [Thermoanaerobaculia bacterium]
MFLISIDTLRSDRLPLYGYEEGSTPAIDRLAKDAVVFRKAFSNVPVTLPSHASIFTGRLPHGHGVRDNIGYALPASHPTLASILRDHGYRTGGAVSSFVMRAETGIARGFEHWDDATTLAPARTISSWQRDGEATRRALSEWLGPHPSGAIFAFLHLYEPHFPYTPPQSCGSRFEDPYDGEVACADAVVGRFLDELRARGLYDQALVILLSDHGEGLGDHGELEHGVFLYREAIQVPLLVKLPGNAKAGEEISHPVSLTDVFPTVLAQLGIARSDDGDGVDLFSAPEPGRLVYGESYYPRLHYGWSELFSLVGEEEHLIEAPVVELYDYRADPGETRNLAAERRREVASMRERIETIRSAHPFEEPQAADPETARKLASLGYLGGGGSSASGARPDPKAKVELLTLFGRGAGSLQRGDHGAAIEIGRAIVRDDPGFLQAWGLIAAAHRERGEHEPALEALREQMRRAPGHPQIALATASLLTEMRRWDEARSHAELAVAWAPSLAWETIGGIELARGELDAALAAAAKAAESAPLRIQPLIIESQVRRARGELGSELALLDRVRARIAQGQAPPLPDLELHRGEALLKLRRAAEAEAAFRAETESFPANHRAWASLALVVGAGGRKEEARAILVRGLERSPGAAMRRAARDALTIMGDAEGLRELGIDGS